MRKRERKVERRLNIQNEILEVVEKLVTRGKITEKMLAWIDEMEKPEDKFRAAIQLIKFGAPQMANQTIQIENKAQQGPTRIVVQAADTKALDKGEDED